ncbi:MAG: class II aldolase/adducin family protein [Candidatus Bathyarchaeia archaeon]|jgi:L-ribulose-5-phosphate 4-epimerase
MSESKLSGIDRAELETLKFKVIEVARGLFENHLVVSTFGVVSVRIPNTEYVLITPSGFSKMTLHNDHLIVVDLEGNLVTGNFRPSVETAMHTYIHKHRPELNTVIHTHSPMACAFAAANMEIPCVSAEQAFYLGGRIPLVRKYSLPGTNKTSELKAILDALKNVDAVLMRKHGVIAVGRTPEQGLETAIVLEDVAKMAFYSIQLAKAKEFTKAELKYLKEFKRTRYGQKPASK